MGQSFTILQALAPAALAAVGSRFALLPLEDRGWLRGDPAFSRRRQLRLIWARMVSNMM